jgi:F-type H+-transporting ATPase subunit delta
MIPYVLTASEDEEQLARGVPDVSSLQVARVYAEALLNAAEEAGQVDEVLGEYEEMLKAAEAPRSELRRFFASGVIGRKRRAEVIRRAFEGRIHPLLVNFLLVINEHERTTLLPAILFEALKLRDERANRLPVSVHSAVPLTDEQQENVRRIIRDRLKLEPVLEMKVDPELLGGLMIRVGDHVFDGTVRTKLVQLREQLLSRSSYEIQSRRDRFSSAE